MKALDYALKILSIGDYSESVLRDKLKRKGFDSDDVDQALAFLKETHIVDDRRYAENYIELKSSVYGGYRMRQHLVKKGIGKELLDELLDEQDKSLEYEAARSFLKKKISGISIAEIDKKKLLGALARKGFSYAVASEVLKSELALADTLNEGEDEAW